MTGYKFMAAGSRYELPRKGDYKKMSKNEIKQRLSVLSKPQAGGLVGWLVAGGRSPEIKIERKKLERELERRNKLKRVM